MSSVREVFAELGLEVDQNAFAAGEAAMGLLKNGLFAVGAGLAAAAAGLAGIIGTTVKAGSEINDMAQRTGVSTDALQKMGYAAKLNGVDMETLAIGMQFLAKTGVKDVQGEMIRLADKFKGMQDGGAKTAEAMKLFGRSGARLIPMLNEGSDGLKKLADRAELLGFVMDAETIKASDDLGDSFDELMMAGKGLAFTLAKPFLKPLTAVVQKVIDWMGANRKLIAGKFSEYIALAANALRYAWQVMEPFVSLLVALASNTWVARGALAALALVMLSQLGGAVKSAVGSVWDLAIGMFKAGASGFLMGLVIGAAFLLILLAVDEVNTYLKGGDTLLGRYGEKFSTWLSEAFAIKHDDPWWLKALKSALDFIFDIQGGFLKIGNWFDSTAAGKWLLRKTKSDEDRIKAQGRNEYEKANNLYPYLSKYDDANFRGTGGHGAPTPLGQTFGPERRAPEAGRQWTPMAFGAGAPVGGATLSAPVTINVTGGGNPEDIGAAVTKHIDNYVGRVFGESYVTVDR